jgi:alpha-beta hydrolase superfamily lysophospholipase
MRLFPVWLTVNLAAATLVRAADSTALLPIETRVTHAYATNNGVRIHFASLGKGPLVVMIHGFPDYWITWRHQMDALAGNYHVVAIDQRGYNLSDKPAGVENYDMRLLVEDVAAVIHACGESKATVMAMTGAGPSLGCLPPSDRR